MEATHPDLFHDVPRATFRAEAAKLADAAPALSRDELVVGLMRLAALPGARDGHTAVYPFDQHARALHVYPFRLYDFPDGLYVVGSIGAEDLTGRRVTAIGGTPIADVVELVRPLVPHDNESGLRWLLPEYVATAEVLRGLGIVEGDTATFCLRRRHARQRSSPSRRARSRRPSAERRRRCRPSTTRSGCAASTTRNG